ncbi:MAG: hypothetical protein HFF36_12425 [Coprobacillus sp.]|nr:hypothetical protein [Coprobacillus sp.]
MEDNVDKKILKEDERIINNDDINKALGKFFISMVRSLYENKIAEVDDEKEQKNIETIRRDFKELVLRLRKPTKDFDIELFVNKLDEYLNDNKRLLYSEFTSIVIELNKSSINDQNVGILISNLESCIDYSMNENNKIPENIQKTLIKLWDHANLASNQYNYFTVTDDVFLKKVSPVIEPKIDELKNQYSSLSTEVENVERELTNATCEAKNIKNKITSDIIALISIFVAISFVMFGGMSLLNGLFDFSNMQYVPMTEMLGLGSLMGIIIIIIIYAFMLFVLKLTDKYEKNGMKLFNIFLIIMIGVLTCVSFSMYSDWKSPKNMEIYKQQKEIQENIKDNQNEDNSLKKQNMDSK